MFPTPIRRIFLIPFMALGLAACATTPAGSTTASSHSGAAPVCVGNADCHAKMNAARLWVAANTSLQLFIDTDDVLETSGWGMPAYTALRINRGAAGNNHHWIRLAIHCGTASGTAGIRVCPDTEGATADFNRVVSAARP